MYTAIYLIHGIGFYPLDKVIHSYNQSQYNGLQLSKFGILVRAEQHLNTPTAVKQEGYFSEILFGTKNDKFTFIFLQHNSHTAIQNWYGHFLSLMTSSSLFSLSRVFILVPKFFLQHFSLVPGYFLFESRNGLKLENLPHYMKFSRHNFTNLKRPYQFRDTRS